MRNLCKHPGCTKTGSFGIEKINEHYCKFHKTSEMILLHKSICQHNNCTTQPNFDLPGGKGSFCVKHKTDEMINVKQINCAQSDCKKQASYNTKGNHPLYCLEHKTSEMINVKQPKCEYISCILRPTYDLPGGKGKFCKKHKDNIMIDVIHKLCEFEGCKSRALYDETKGKGKYCAKHKTNTMINTTYKYCEHPNCKIVSPSFDFINGKGRFCITHKQNGMINIKTKFCKECNTGVSYGKPGNPMTHCAKHRQPGMIRRSNYKCKVTSCKLPAIFGSNFSANHCETHKLDNEINLVERNCKSCNLLTTLNNDEKCEYCIPETIQRALLEKQTLLFQYIDSNIDIPKATSTDRTINNGECGKERPDRIYDFSDKIIILECDEHQHKTRDCVCEQTRMINISQSFGGTPVYFIRWNPDKYTTENNEMEKIGKRHKLVGEMLKNIYENKLKLPDALLSAIYLYYDGWTGIHNEKWQQILNFDV